MTLSTGSHSIKATWDPWATFRLQANQICFLIWDLSLKRYCEIQYERAKCRDCDASVETLIWITFQTLVLIWFAKILSHVVLCCQDSLISIRIQSGCAKNGFGLSVWTHQGTNLHCNSTKHYNLYLLLTWVWPLKTHNVVLRKEF